MFDKPLNPGFFLGGIGGGGPLRIDFSGSNVKGGRDFIIPEKARTIPGI